MNWQQIIITTVSAVGLLAIESQGSVLIDLRFNDGSKTLSVNAGNLTPITIRAWAIVTGTVGNNNPEGLQSAIFALKSKIVSSGIGGSITSSTSVPGWNSLGSFTGSTSNISPDGIGDWGNASNTPLSLTNSFFRARTTKSANNSVDWGDIDSPAGTFFNVLPNGGREFMVGSFTFTPTSMQNLSSLQYLPVVPLGGTVATATWAEDSSDKTAPIPPPGSKSNQVAGSVYGPLTPNTPGINGVTINAIPEPAALGLLGMGVIELRRRRSI